MAARVTEIAENVYQISTYVEPANFRFNQFLVLDEQPLLYHTGTNSLFPEVRQAVATLLDPSHIRWIGFSHFEADECGALAAWQSLAPQATAICGLTSKVVSVDDAAALRPARPLADGRWRNVFHREIPLPFPAHAARTARLGCRPFLRGNPGNPVLFGPVPPGRRPRSADLR